MAIGSDGFRMSQLDGCVRRASTYMLSEADARELIDHQVETILRDWREVCEIAGMTKTDRALFRGRQFLNPYAFEGYCAPPQLERVARAVER